MTRSEFFKAIGAAAVATLPVSKAEPNVVEVPSGKLYCLQFDDELSPMDVAHVRHELRPFEKQFGCGFLILGKGVRLITQGGVRVIRPDVDDLLDKLEVRLSERLRSQGLKL